VQILSGLPASTDPGLLVGAHTLDDAAVVRWPNSRDLLLKTLDVITPVVDNPFDFGRIAAANALSDIYAMGGEPVVALVFAAVPEGLGLDVIRAIFEGGASAVAEAGAVIGGGHTMRDAELKYGLSVTGRVSPERLVTNAGGRPGDVLVLSKPLGTGILHSALKAGTLSDAECAAWTRSMSTLNAGAARAMAAVGAHAATDVTGFGLLGHGMQLARASGVALRLFSNNFPMLPGVAERLGDTLGGPSARNAAYAAPHLAPSKALRLLADPQTSGGMLMAVEKDRVEALITALQAEACLSSAVVGCLEAGTPGHVFVE
jgi:selenide,water dikinase